MLLYNRSFLFLFSYVFHRYLAICQAVRSPPQNVAEAKKLGGRSTARKSLHFTSYLFLAIQ
ncbi:hypothetical protein BK702_18815 [Bacillus thuringiensis serovar cameroun]|nr:hypothetical protein BK702_18815 [Bacillus thuringiensis serovar cameroun]